MSSKAEKDRQKQIQDRCLSLLNQMLKDDDNKYCVDCDSKGKYLMSTKRYSVAKCHRLQTQDRDGPLGIWEYSCA